MFLKRLPWLVIETCCKIIFLLQYQHLFIAILFVKMSSVYRALRVHPTSTLISYHVLQTFYEQLFWQFSFTKKIKILQNYKLQLQVQKRTKELKTLLYKKPARKM